MKFNALFVLFFGVCFAENHSSPHFITTDEQGSDSEVIYASILFRHGDRTPNLILSTDPYELSYWEEGKGQLTKVGKLHAYELGKWARQYYASLVADKPYRGDVLTTLSSDVDRTLMSAEAFLAGMYPPSDEEMWNSDNLRWQPIPVHTIPTSLDNLLSFPNGICERYDLEALSSTRYPELIAFYQKNQDLFEYVSINSGKDMSIDDIPHAFIAMYYVYDTLLIEVQNNRTLQNWTREVFPEPLKSMTEGILSILSYTDEMKRLRGGPLLKSMLDDLTKKATNSSWNAKFRFYSGHDTTISVLMDTLNIYNRLVPPCSSAFVIELRKKEEQHLVRVLYRNSSLTTPYILKIPDCESDDCTLDEFIRVTTSRIPDDWASECEVDFFTKLSYKFTFFELVVAGIIIILLIVVLITMTYRICITRHRRKHYQTIPDSIDSNTRP